MKWRLVYEDLHGNCRIVVPNDRYRQAKETEEQAIARLYAQSMQGVIEFLACRQEDLPKDETFREAWRKGDCKEPIKIDFPKSVEIHRGRLKEAATLKIARLKDELVTAVQKSDLPLQVAIKRTCEILENIHNMNMTHCKTVDDVKYCIPQELQGVWHWYPPIRVTFDFR